MELLVMGNSLTLLEHLDNIRSTGVDTYRAVCPHHEGRSRSLAVKVVDGRILIHCFAGCSPDEVLSAVGLSMSDLFDESPEMSPVERKDRIRSANAREILKAINLPVRAVMIAMGIQTCRPLSANERISFERAGSIVNKALDAAINQGVLNV
jgi:hypothetical protein